MGWLQNKFEKNFLISTVDYVFNWARKSAVWPMTFGLACCAIEMMSMSASRFDISRFGDPTNIWVGGIKVQEECSKRITYDHRSCS